MILDRFPSTEDFYKIYWGKKPFIVRGHVAPDLIERLIDGDALAGLALEGDIRSRIITNAPEGDNWTCEHGPFDENRFADLGTRDWSLLVQNVEQYHTETAGLFECFQSSPRWLIDDIMVSYSAPGGSVGPHTDSYHTFLVQGIGKRAWKISDMRIDDDRYIDNQDMKILKNGFEGKTFEVTVGDVIYMPPFFGHEGKTLEAAMTFSVGFLGPKISEILGEYAQYLEENDTLNKRYLGEALDTDSVAFMVGTSVQNAIKGDAISAIQSDDFSCWLAGYFSAPTHDDVENIDLPEDTLSSEGMLEALQNGAILYRPNHVKMTVTVASNGQLNLAVYGGVIVVSIAQAKLIQMLSDGQEIAQGYLKGFGDQSEIVTILSDLYNKGALFFSERD